MLSFFAMQSVTQNFFNINEGCVKYKMMRKIQGILLDMGYTIFGGYVRDMLIHDHYSRKFYGNGVYSNENYVDESLDKKTLGRLIVPKDIDCFFTGDGECVEALRLAFIQGGFDVMVMGSQEYAIFNNVKKRSLRLTVANAHLFGLHCFKVFLDVLYSSDPDIKPPFGKLDLTCNALVLTDKGISLSNNTGTSLDILGPFEKKCYETKIIKKLLKFKTVAVSNVAVDSDKPEENHDVPDNASNDDLPEDKCLAEITGGVMGKYKSKEDFVDDVNPSSGISREQYYRITKMLERGWIVDV